MWYPISISVSICSTFENQDPLRIMISSKAEIILQFCGVLVIVYYIPLMLRVATSVAT